MQKGIYDEAKGVYRVENKDGSFSTYTPEQYRELETEEEDAVEVEEYTGELGTYLILKEIPYTDEKGNLEGVTEIGSVQEVPVELGEDWVKSGDAKQISITKAALELAQTEGIDITTVKGTGANGKITKGDVEEAIKNKEAQK